jgi:hypothetical protein
VNFSFELNVEDTAHEWSMFLDNAKLKAADAG